MGDQQKLLAATRVTYNEKEQQVKKAEAEYDDVTKEFKATRTSMRERLSKVNAKLSAAIKAVFKALASVAPKQKSLREELDLFDKCNQDKSDEKSGYSLLNTQFRDIQKQIDRINTDIGNAEKEKAQVEAETEKKTKELNADLKKKKKKKKKRGLKKKKKKKKK